MKKWIREEEVKKIGEEEGRRKKASIEIREEEGRKKKKERTGISSFRNILVYYIA